MESRVFDQDIDEGVGNLLQEIPISGQVYFLFLFLFYFEKDLSKQTDISSAFPNRDHSNILFTHVSGYSLGNTFMVWLVKDNVTL